MPCNPSVGTEFSKAVRVLGLSVVAGKMIRMTFSFLGVILMCECGFVIKFLLQREVYTATVSPPI